MLNIGNIAILILTTFIFWSNSSNAGTINTLLLSRTIDVGGDISGTITVGDDGKIESFDLLINDSEYYYEGSMEDSNINGLVQFESGEVQIFSDSDLTDATNYIKIDFGQPLSDVTSGDGYSYKDIYIDYQEGTNSVTEGSGSVVPIPATALLFASGLLGFFGVARSKIIFKKHSSFS